MRIKAVTLNKMQAPTTFKTIFSFLTISLMDLIRAKRQADNETICTQFINNTSLVRHPDKFFNGFLILSNRSERYVESHLVIDVTLIVRMLDREEELLTLLEGTIGTPVQHPFQCQNGFFACQGHLAGSQC